MIKKFLIFCSCAFILLGGFLGCSDSTEPENSDVGEVVPIFSIIFPQFSPGDPTNANSTADGGCIVSADGVLFKTSITGDVEWQTSIDLSQTVAKQTQDGGYMVVGYESESNNGAAKKLDENGSVQWEQYYNLSDHWTPARSFLQTQDLGYVIYFAEVPFDENPFTGWVMKTDSNGDPEWTRNYGDLWAPYIGQSICETDDGGYLLLSPGVLKKLNALGDEVWTRSAADLGGGHLEVFIRTGLAELIIGGTNGSTGILMATSDTGVLTWRKDIEGLEKVESIALSSDGTTLLAGRKNFNPVMIAANNFGVEQWENVMVINGGFNSVSTNGAGGFVFCGANESGVFLCSVSQTGDFAEFSSGQRF